MGTQGTGRKRSTKKERSTAEDDALNLIAREAEARLAAKRAARAEAREIRMKELERQQKEIFQVQKKYYGLDTKLDDRGDSKWGDIEQWMEDSERYSRSSRIHTLSDDDERMSVGSRGSVRSDLDAVGAYGGGGSSSHKKSKKKKKHKHKDKDRNGYDDDYSLISSRSSRLSDESRASRSSRLDLTSSRLSDDTRLSRASRLDLQPASYASSDFSFNGLSSSRNPGSAFNGYQFYRSLSQISQQLYRRSSLYEESLCSGSRRAAGSTSLPLDYTSYRSSGSRASSRASSARASPVDNCGSVASYLRSAAGSGGLPRDLDDVTIPDFSDVEDRDYLEKGSRAASALTAGTLTSLGGTSSRRGSGETALTLDAETSIREIKEIHELKDQIQDVESKYTQNLKEAKDALAVVEEKYRKAMVSNAQLDNEKNNLMYQVDTLKDSLMELEEMLAESQRSYEEKVKEHEREKHAHGVLQFQFNEMKEMLKQSEELLNEIRQLRIKQEGFVREISDLQETVEWKDKKIGALERQKEYTDAIRIERDELREEVVKLKDILKKHGIVLGPDLNINGDVGETEVDGSPSADPASQLAPDSQTSPTEGNSMLGNAEASQLRSSREEEVDPEQHQEMFEEAKVNHLSSDPLCNVVSTLETPPEEPREEQQTCLATEEDTVKESVLSKDLNVDIIDSPDTEAKDVIVCSPELQATVTRSDKTVSGTKMPEGGNLVEIETKPDGVDTPRDDISESCNNVSEEKANKEECVEKSRLINTESCHQQTVAQDVMKESSPDESARDSVEVELQQEPGNAEEAENDEAEEAPSKSQPHGASGKKKRKKRKGKKKGATQVDKNQEKDGTDTEKSQKSDKKIESAAKDEGPTTDPDINGSVSETVKDSNVDQVKNEPNGEKTEAVDGVRAETFSHNETPKEPRMDRVTDEHDKEQTLETDPVEEVEAVTTTETFSHVETVKESVVDRDMDEQKEELRLESETVEAVEAVSPTETSSHMETLKESRSEPEKDEQDEEQTLDKAEEVGSITSAVPEINIIPPDPSDPEGAEDPDGLDQVCTSGEDNSKSETDISTDANVVDTESEIVDSEARPVECTTSDPERTFETNEENTDVQNDVAADESESMPGSLPSVDVVTDDLESLSASELPSAAASSGNDDAPDEVSDQVKDPEKETEVVEEDEELKAETEQESFPPGPSGDKTEVKPDGTENEDLNGDLREPESLVEPGCSSHEEKNDGGLLHHDEKDVLETAAQLEEEESQLVQHKDQIDQLCAEMPSETEEINTSAKSNTPDSPNGAKDPGPEESAEADDPERPNDPQTETSEAGKDEPEDDNNDASQPPLQDSDEGDDEDDEEGQSFDFDDMDVEAAVTTDLAESPKQTEVEEGVEVRSDESNHKTDQNEDTQLERVENSEENQADAPDKEPCTRRDKGASENEEQDNTPEEDEPRHIIEEGKALIVGALGAVADKITQAMSAPVEEGLDAAKQELQAGDSVSPKSADQEGGGKEPAQSGKDVRKNSKKGKAKGKEDCKMS